MTGISVPAVDWVNPGALMADPYPTYKRLRDEAPFAFVPMMNATFITKFDDCKAIEADQESFSALLDKNMMHRTMGRPTMLNKDDPEHAAERAPLNKTLTNRAMNENWTDVFTRNAQKGLELLGSKQLSEADLNADFAVPVSAWNLIDLLGLQGVEVEDVARWSTTLIAGLSNVMNDEEVWKKVEKVNEELDEAIERSADYLRLNPNNSMISAYLNSSVPWDNVVANIKLSISGGFNEPQHAITSMVWALSEHPEQRQQVLENPELWPKVFEESLRWVSPVGYIPRRVTKDLEFGGYSFKKGDVLASMIAAANRDETRFVNPDEFNIHREETVHFGFGSGVHICAGMWAARLSIGKIAVPMLYERFPEIRTAQDGREAQWLGFVFRGLLKYPITY